MAARIAICSLFLLTGCATAPEATNNASLLSGQNSPSGGIATVGNSIRSSWNRIADGVAKKDTPVQAWQWQSGIPSGAQRAELVSTVLPAHAVAHFVPTMQGSQIQLVSSPQQSAKCQIASVGGQAVRNLAELDYVVERVFETNDNVSIVFRNGNTESDPVEVTPATLASLCQAAGGDSNVMRLVDDGKPSILIREDGIRCKLTARGERESGIVQIIMSIRNCWGSQQPLPKEVMASFNGQPLRCLTVAESLERLYGDRVFAKVDDLAGSFSAVSEREDYLIPTNYQRLLQRQMEKIPENSLRVRQQPALVLVAGEAYPGPAVLGDARALSEFLLQRQLYRPDDPDRAGWIMFAVEPDAIRKGGTFDIEIDLGYGLRKYRFMLPASG